MNKREAYKILEEIAEMRTEVDLQLHALKRSIHLQSIWPEAFKDGQSCKLCAPPMTAYMLRDLESGKELVAGAYLQRCGDGAVFQLTPEQFRELHNQGREIT